MFESMPPRMRYRSHPVSVAVDPVSLVISECISLTSEIRKRAPSPHTSVSAILGGNTNPMTLSVSTGSVLGPSSSSVGVVGPTPTHGSRPVSAISSPQRTPVAPSARSSLDAHKADDGLSRWGLRGKKGRSVQDNPLMAGFGRLRHELSGVSDIHAFDAVALLSPFLHVLQAKGTAAPITILALAALRKFLAYGFVGPTSPRFPLAMQSLSSALTHCQFADSGQMEVVLLMILNLMEDMISGPGGDILSDESICNMMERGLAICSSPRFSPVLRQTAETAMIRMCQVIFEDVKHLEAEALALDLTSETTVDTAQNMDPGSAPDSRLQNQRDGPDGGQQQQQQPRRPSRRATKNEEQIQGKSTLGMNSPVHSPVTMDPTSASKTWESGTNDTVDQAEGDTEKQGELSISTATETLEATSETVETRESTLPPNNTLKPTSTLEADDQANDQLPQQNPAENESTATAPESTIPDSTESGVELDIRPYSLSSVRELIRVLINFLDPHQLQYTRSMRIMSLRILHVALEVAGPSIARHPALAPLIEDGLCRHLFQLVRSDNMDILQEALVVASTLLTTCRSLLKLQQELFLSYLIACLHPMVSIPREPGIDPSLYADIPQAPKLAKPLSRSASSASSSAAAAATTTTNSSSSTVASLASHDVSGRSTPVMVQDRQKLGLEGDHARKPDARQAMVECVGVLMRMPTFMAELFVNYDCDVNRSDLCEDVIGFLARSALPDSATWSTTSVPPLCLDALLRFVQFLAERMDVEPDDSLSEHLPPPEALRQRRERKKLVITGSAKFNEHPKKGLAWLESQGLVDTGDPRLIAHFLRTTSRHIAKPVLGDFLSKRGNEAILDAFLDLFDFSGKRVDEALRMMLESFRLPGEAPLIQRIVNTFAEKYFAHADQGDVVHKDGIYVLTYAMIILNTDQHNPNLKGQRRMTFDDFSRNLRGQNGSGDFHPDYLRGIFDNIHENEIILPEEHDNQHGFHYAWRELLSKAEEEGPLRVCDGRYDADLFGLTWRPIVSTLSYVFVSAQDDAVFARVVAGFDECAQLAARYAIPEALDQIVYCLSLVTTMSVPLPTNTALHTEVQTPSTGAVRATPSDLDAKEQKPPTTRTAESTLSEDSSSVIVSPLSVRLGRDFRAQLATLVLFRIVHGNEHVLSRGWRSIGNIWLNLFVNSLLPFPHFVARPSQTTLSNLPAIPLLPPSQVVDRAKPTDTGFFSAFTSYISSYAADDPPEPSDEDLENTLCAMDCVKQCRMDEVFDHVFHLPVPPLTVLIQSLLELLPEDQNHSIISVKTESPLSSSSPLHGGPRRRPRSVSSAVRYDPTVVYILELCTRLALRDETATQAVGTKVASALLNLLRSARQHHILTISRTCLYLLALLAAGYGYNVVNVTILLHTISALPEDILCNAGDLILVGIRPCVAQANPLRTEIMTSPDFWSILSVLSVHAETAQATFSVLEGGLSAGRETEKSGGGDLDTQASTAKDISSVVAENYEDVVQLLSRFASMTRFTTTSSTTTTTTSTNTGHHLRPGHVPRRRVEEDEATVARGVQAIHYLNQLTERIPDMMQRSHLETSQIWSAYWLPIFQALTSQCTNPCREVRLLAFHSLQRTLFSPAIVHTRDPALDRQAHERQSLDRHSLDRQSLDRQSLDRQSLDRPSQDQQSSQQAWSAIFEQVLFPLIGALLKPEVFVIDREGMSDMRIQAASLLCKVFLQYLVAATSSTGSTTTSSSAPSTASASTASSSAGMVDLWVQMLEVMDRLLHSGQGGVLEDAVRENLKNVVLFMTSSGLLSAAGPNDPGDRASSVARDLSSAAAKAYTPHSTTSDETDVRKTEDTANTDQNSTEDTAKSTGQNSTEDTDQNGDQDAGPTHGDRTHDESTHDIPSQALMGPSIPADGDRSWKDRLWTETWQRMDRFLPDLQAEILALEETVREPPPSAVPE